MAVFVAIMAGESASEAEPVFASSDPVLVSAVSNWVSKKLGPQPVSKILAEEGFQSTLSPDARRAIREGVNSSHDDLKPAA